jgi:NAD(P)-dependent dehydrogenase (short-subunit alcohol dehydrogenase family)
MLVTGAASGLGRAVSELLTASGAVVATLDRAETQGACPLRTDVTDAESVASAVAEVVDRFGRLDGVAHCAGVFNNTLDPVHRLSAEAWAGTLDVNLNGSFHVAQASLPHLMESRGRIVFVGSVAGRFPQPGGAAYSASKAAVAALARSIALEYAPHGVTSNCVMPGYMDTGMTAFLSDRPALRERIVERIPLERFADPDEVARVVCALLTDTSSYLTGQEIVVDGGSSLTAFVGTRDVARMWDRITPPQAP